jgi:fatty-acyl-CoA synthase
MTSDWSLAAVHDVLADAVPERDMLVWKDVRRSYADVAERTRGLAGYFASHGLCLDSERDELERWECGQATVAIVMHNRPEYLETMLGAYRTRAVPFNVNQHYTPGEVGTLFSLVGTRAVVYQRSLAPLVAAALDVLADIGADRPSRLVDVDDGSGVAPLDGSVGYEEAIASGRTVAEQGALPTPSPDDLYLVCTGGTTGSPKAVLWRQGDIFVAGMAGSDLATAESLATNAREHPTVFFATPPLMHAASQWTAFSGIHLGGTVVLHDDTKRFDAATILATAEREHAVVMSIVGDAYARPIIDELRRTSYDLSSLQRIGTGGTSTSLEAKEALVELLPTTYIVDGYGASETGGMAFGVSSKAGVAPGLSPASGALVLSADRSRLLEPGDDEVGWTARRGRVPLGYLDDREATERTFPIVDGERVAVPGDRARLGDDGTIRMLGRDSMVVNSGGEKVFVEEVEQALLTHPDVVDVLVVGRPEPRLGHEVVAVVQLAPGATVTPAELREHAAATVARFKAPRAVAFVDHVGRHASGKPDYRWATGAAAAATSAV